MSVIQNIQIGVSQAVKSLFAHEIAPAEVQVTPTSSDFEGDFTVVIFPFVRFAKKAPEAVGQAIGEFLNEKMATEIGSFNCIKGFLNLSLNETYWQQFLTQTADNQAFGRQPRNGRKVMVEFSSPNTNKPLHLGHIRNICLGWSCAKVLDAVGYEVMRVQIINDRGIAICKSMLAWLKFGEGKTPADLGQKSDHVVGDFYVRFEKEFKNEYKNWQLSKEGQSFLQSKIKDGQSEADFWSDYKNSYFNNESELGAAARDLLQKWETGDEATISLWKKMNGWVYAGFDETYKNLGVEFDKLYFESNTYLLGKEIIDDGLAKNVFFRKPDSSVWIDLTEAGFDQKLLLRSDGTSVYMTQDLGTARMRFEESGFEKCIYVVADEQNYHFSVLFEILKRLGEPYATGLYHLNYGMVELPTGRMKSREGTVVDADDLMDEVVGEAQKSALERGDIGSFSADEQATILRQVGLAALKFFILKVHPKKKMIFDPTESVALDGQTGPYIQYSFARINSLMQRVEREGFSLESASNYSEIQPQEKELLRTLHGYPAVVQLAADEYDPSQIAHYCYDLAKKYHRFWHDLSVFNAENEVAKAFRLRLSKAVGQVLKNGFELLGIEMPQRM